MLKNHMRTAVRQFLNNPVYSSLNILGLAVGTACFFLIFLWVEHETGYDRALPNADRIYRVTTDVHLPSGQDKIYALSTSGLAVALKAEYPEVLASTRIAPSEQILLRSGDAAFFERNFVYADSNFLEVFRFTLTAGDPSEAMKRPYSLLMTRATAAKYFGREDPVGKTLTADNRQSYTVTGILEDAGTPSHIRADFIANPGTAHFFNHPTWNALGVYSYVELDRRADPSAFEAKIQDLATKYVGPKGKELFRYRLQPVTSIHLHSDREGEFATVVGVTQVRLLSAVAVMILLVACVNFVNLSTARAGRRAREVGVRKVLGARRGGLFRQFLFESSLSTLAAFGVGLGLARLALPWFNSLWATSFGLDLKHHLPILFPLAVVTGLLAGSYPALILSSFRPGVTLKGPRGHGGAAAFLRKSLIVSQYAAAIILLISTAVVSGQMNYLRKKNLGFDRNRILGVHLRSPDVVRGIEGVKHELLRDPEIVAAAAAEGIPGLGTAVVPYVPEGFDGNSILVRTLYVDHDFIPSLGLKIVEGRAFSREFPSDTTTAYIINETARLRFGWTHAVGKTITCTFREERDDRAKGRVIGVVEDIHVRSLREPVEPVIIRVRPEALQFLYLKLRGTDLLRTRASVEARMAALQPQYPPETFFLDAVLDGLYGNESRLGRIFKDFSLITILVACVGLFGLAAYDAEQRTKEIGIRKVLGATIPDILWLLTRESAGLLVLANLISWPVGYFLMENWLRGFAYRTSVGPAVLVVSGAAALAVALITVSVQAYRAAVADPVRSIRYE
jgi:putative ABC transport system permease protein